MKTNQDILYYLSSLSKNNNRAWFDEHKSEYKELSSYFKEFVFELASRVSLFDKGVYAEPDFIKMFRIYRDIRFSKNKTPYKENFGATITHGGKKSINPAYYIHLQPGNRSFVGGGWFTGDSQLLYAVRKYISDHHQEFDTLMNSASITKNFTMGEYMGVLKTAPKGFAKDDPALEYIKHKSFTLGVDLSDKDVVSRKLPDKIIGYFEQLYPFQQFFYKALKDINKQPGLYKRK